MSPLTDSLSGADSLYTSHRMPIVAARGVVATSSALAAQAGLEILKRGGNAVDAAIATAASAPVVEPTQNGLGSDAFAIVWDGSKLHGINGSGRAPAALTPDVPALKGLSQMPGRGWPAVTVPGAPRTWRDLHDRFGKLPFASLFEPAIAYAEDGFALGPQTASAWAGTQQRYRENNIGPEYAGWFETFAPDDRKARAGDIWRLPDHGRTLRLIAESGAEAYYKGEIADRIADWAARTGGYITRDDLAAHSSTWVEPVSAAYHGYEAWELPPNGQGLVALQALRILDALDVSTHPRDSIEAYHLQIEAIKLAFADGHAYVADPAKSDVPVSALLDESYISRRRTMITDRALDPPPGEPRRGGTVYICTADADGMMVSFIQSNYIGFGSGIVVPGTGIALQNRGSGFSLQPGHPNLLAPGKRPYHTLMPGFLTQGGEAIGPFGVMGTEMQPQGHVQMVVNQVDYGMNPQVSLDAPRFRWIRGKQINLEETVPSSIVDGLAARGHEVDVRQGYFGAIFGRGQIIRRLANGAYVAGSDSRGDGCAAGY